MNTVNEKNWCAKATNFELEIEDRGHLAEHREGGIKGIKEETEEVMGYRLSKHGFSG